jgi:hypothetical protein
MHAPTKVGALVYLIAPDAALDGEGTVGNFTRMFLRCRVGGHYLNTPSSR